MNAEEWLSREGINPIEPIYWDFIESSITLEEVLEQYAEYKQLQNKAPNNNYTKCLDELWEHIELNAKNGSFAKSSIAEILKKHFV